MAIYKLLSGIVYERSPVVFLSTKCIEKYRNFNVDFVGNTDDTYTEDECRNPTCYDYITLLLSYIKVFG